MSNTNAHACLRIDCTLSQAKELIAALTFLSTYMEQWKKAPVSTSELPENAGHWPEPIKWMAVELAQHCFEQEQDYLAFDWRMDLPTIQGRPVETETGFNGLVLEGDQIEDDIFVAAHLILKAIESEQVICTGTAYTGDRADTHTYGGSYVTISRYEWAHMLDGDDYTATEIEAVNHHAYWMVTYGPESAAAPNSFVWVTSARFDQESATTRLLTAAERVGLPESIESGDLTLTRIPGLVYRHLTPVLPVHECGTLTYASTTTLERIA